MLCYCYDVSHVIVMMCHKRPGVLQVIKVTALIRATLTKLKVDDPPWCYIFKSELRREFQWRVLKS